MNELRRLVEKGVAPNERYLVWQIYFGLISVKKRDRIKNREQLKQYYNTLLSKHYTNKKLEDISSKLEKQIEVDCNRISILGYRLFENQEILKILKRILYVWSKEFEEMGYFQGIHEILAIILFYYLYQYVEPPKNESNFTLLKDEFDNLELDCFFSLKNMINWIFFDFGSTKEMVFSDGMINQISSIMKSNSSINFLFAFIFFYQQFFFLLF